MATPEEIGVALTMMGWRQIPAPYDPPERPWYEEPERRWQICVDPTRCHFRYGAAKGMENWCENSIEDIADMIGVMRDMEHDPVESRRARHLKRRL